MKINYDEPLTDAEIDEIKQAMIEGMNATKLMFQFVKDQNLTSRQAAVACMFMLAIISKSDDIDCEHVVETLRNMWDNIEMSEVDFH